MENNVICVYKLQRRKDNKTVGGEKDQNIASRLEEHLRQIPAQQHASDMHFDKCEYLKIGFFLLLDIGTI